MAVNVDTGSYKTYDQLIKDEKIVAVESKLDSLGYTQMLAFADNLNQEIERNSPEWFSRLLSDIQLIVPIKKSEDRKIGNETRLKLIRIIFGIYNTPEDYIMLLTSVFPLYEFIYNPRGPSFQNEDRTGNDNRLRINVDPLLEIGIRPGFPCIDFIVLIHEIAHSINASVPRSKLESLREPSKIETYKLLNRSSGVIQFIKEYLSDVTAMMLSNKEGEDPISFSYATERALDRVRKNLRIYPGLQAYVNANGWESLTELASIIPNNLVMVGEISRIISEVLTEYVNEKKINTDAVPGVTIEDEDILLSKLVDRIKPIFQEIQDAVQAKSEGSTLDEHQKFLEANSNLSRSYYYSEGADTVLKILEEVTQ